MKTLILSSLLFLFCHVYSFGQESVSTEKATELIIVESVIIETPEGTKKSTTNKLLTVEETENTETVPVSNTLQNGVNVEATEVEKKKIPPKEN